MGIFVPPRRDESRSDSSTISLKSDVFQSDPLQNLIMAKGFVSNTVPYYHDFMSDGPGVGVSVIECTGTMLTDSDLIVYVDCFQMIYFYVIFCCSPLCPPGIQEVPGFLFECPTSSMA